METTLVKEALVNEQAMNSLLNQCQGFFEKQPILRWLDDDDDRDDVVQHSLIRTWKDLSNYRFDGPFEAWLYRILKNQYFTHVVQKHRDGMFVSYDELIESGEEIDPLDEAADPARVYEAREYIEHVLDTIPDILTESEYRCLMLCGYQGATAEEAAQELNLSENSVKQFVHQARKKLREAFPNALEE